MSLINILYGIYEDSVENAVEGFETAAEIASELVDSFEENVETLSDSFKSLANSDSQESGMIVDLSIELIKSIVDNGQYVQTRLSKVIDMSIGYIINGDDNLIIDFLEALFDNFKNQFEYYESILRIILDHFDFEKILKKVLEYTSDNFDRFKYILEYLLTPLFLVGIILLGAEKMAKITRAYLKTNSSIFSQSININEVIPAQQAFLTTIRNDNFFDFSMIQYCFVGIFENLRRGANLYSTNSFFYDIENPILKLINDSIFGFFENMGTLFISPFYNIILDFFQEFLALAEDDIELEWRILEIARITPIGLLFIMIAVPYKLLTSPAPFINLIFNPIEEDPNFNTLRLHCPDKEHKYIFFSDIHRDAKEDKRPEFQFLSIDHFDPNGAQYLELLEYYDKEGYTIIEVGDCEELWFHRDFQIRPHEKLDSVIQKYQAIYDKLRDLHNQGRYYRVYGNHDSYLREDDQTRAVLFNHFDSTENPFTIYDFIIIDGVKTMTDVQFYLGLDSEPNKEMKPMIVTHGHQWDFWNCDANNILGKLIVSAVVTPLDFLDDPFKDIGGISMSGSPGFNFKSFLADLFVYNNWLAKEPANKAADRIQHKDDDTRLFVDDIMYSESLASLMGNLIFVKAENDCYEYDTLCNEDYVLFNLLCIGHTHNPQNMPYHELENIPIIGDYINQLENGLERITGGIIPFEFLSLVKSNYINTGTSGWWEKTIWALDLGNVSHCTGQPKLINWSENTKIEAPNEMDWELPHLDHEGPNSKGERLEDLHADILQWITNMLQELRNRGEDLLVSSPAGSLLDLVRFGNGNVAELELIIPAELYGILDHMIELVGFTLNQLAAICKEIIDYTISIRIELPKQYTKLLAQHSRHFSKTKHHDFIQLIGLIAAKDMITKVQFRDSDRGNLHKAVSVEEKLNSSLMTLAWLFNPNNEYKGSKSQIRLDSSWEIKNQELLINLNFQKKTKSIHKSK